MPACVTRVGPSRSGVSVPRSKSKTSFARLLPICKSNAANKHASAASKRKNPSYHASAQPITTPEAAAGKVRGRIANPQACKFSLGQNNISV